MSQTLNNYTKRIAKNPKLQDHRLGIEDLMVSLLACSSY